MVSSHGISLLVTLKGRFESSGLQLRRDVMTASGVMCSYFAPNGVSSCGNEYLLNDRIRTAWNHPDAVVMSGKYTGAICRCM